jgi:mono/diheme cytochrome c family protein
MECHTGAAGFALGPEIAQLNRDLTYPSTGRVANQLATIDHVMMFTAPLPGSVDTLDVLTDPADTSAPLDLRARAYLHTNCAQCHRPNGPAPSTMDLRYSTALTDTNACDVQPLEGDLGIQNARLIAPGNSGASLIVNRMQRRDSHGMPPLGSNVVDASGVATITAWIDGLSACN